MTANPWLTYWETLPEGRLLFPPESEEFARNFRATIQPSPQDRLLDYGCGFGHIAGLLAPHVGEIHIWDAAPKMRDVTATRLQSLPNVRVWDEAVGDFNLIAINSVVQYMTPNELGERIQQWANLLKPSGRIVLSDLSEPGHSALSDMWSLFRFSVRRRYLLSAVRNTLAERRRYNAAAKSRPLYHPARSAIGEFARSAGLAVQYLPWNLTHFRGRSTALLTRTSHAAIRHES